MKNISFYKPLLLIIIIATAFGCSKKLDEHIYSQDTPNNFYQSTEQVVSAYVQPYSYLQTHIYQVHFQDVEFVTDEACCPVLFGYIDQQGQWLRFHQHAWASPDVWILLEWQDLYQAIGYCNNFIKGLGNTDVSKLTLPVSKPQMIAEARLMRALHYYWALNEFGNIPVVDSVGEQDPPNKTPKEAFTFIEKEIKESIPDLSEKGDDYWYGHFTKTSAYALLAKLYLNAQVMIGEDHYQDCMDACDYVINSGKYNLDANWNDPFLVHNETSNENIFVVPFDANNAQGFDFIEQNIHENIPAAKYGNDYGYRKIATQESFYQLYTKKDYRINQWIVGPQTYIDDNGDKQPIYDYEGDPMVITPTINDLFNAGDDEGVMNQKYEIESGLNYGINGQVNMNNDMVVFRYADILFMKAECLMRMNGGNATQEAVDLINQVRKRDFSAEDFLNTKYTTSSLTMNELLNERGREFAYEMFRREDLIRFGKFEDAWWEKPADADKHLELFPIPQTVLTTNPALKQNPGY